MSRTFEGVDYTLIVFQVHCYPVCSINATIEMTVQDDDERVQLARRRRDVNEGDLVALFAEYDPNIHSPGTVSLTIRDEEDVYEILNNDLDGIENAIMNHAEENEIIPLAIMGMGRNKHIPDKPVGNIRDKIKPFTQRIKTQSTKEDSENG